MERTTASRVKPEHGLRDAVAGVVADAPDRGLREVAIAACAGVEDSIGPLIVADLDGGAGPAAVAAGLLEAAERAEGVVHGLGGRAPHEQIFEVDDNRAAALAAAWLRTRALELAAELGDESLLSAGDALARIADGQMLEVEDLYDAGRPPERCLEAVQLVRGGLGSFAAGAAAGAAVAEAGARIATASRIGDDVRSLVPGLVPAPRRAGEALTRGLYTLPVAYALEEDPKLAESLGGAVADEALSEIVERIRATGALARCAVTCRRLTSEAGPLSRLGDEIAEACEEAGRA